MDPMKIFAARSKAVEGSYFKPEQDIAVRQHADLLKSQGRFDQVPSRTANVAGAVNVLPEILSHELPLDITRQAARVSTSKGYYVSKPKPMFGAMADSFMRPSIYSNVLIGGDVIRTGRVKWDASQVGGESLFDVGAARRLIEEEAENQAKRARFLNVKPVKPMPILTLGGIPLKLFPDPSGGRALFWGTLIAVWMGSALGSFTLKTLNVSTVEEFKPAMKQTLAPFRDYCRDYTADFRERVANGETAYDTSGFADSLKNNVMN